MRTFLSLSNLESIYRKVIYSYFCENIFFVDSHAIWPWFGTFDIAATFHLCTALTGLRRCLVNWIGMAAWQRGTVAMWQHGSMAARQWPRRWALVIRSQSKPTANGLLWHNLNCQCRAVCNSFLFYALCSMQTHLNTPGAVSAQSVNRAEL